jgi:hypothetical protein
MHKRQHMTLTLGLLVFLMLSACSQDINTSGWEEFTIEEAPGFDIQFLIPSDWESNYLLPMETAPGQWRVLLTPPRCSSDQSEDYGESCIILTAYVKGEAEFDENEVLALISENIPLSQDGAESILMGQTSLDVNGLTIQRYTHKINSANGEVQLSYYYFQTDSAYYTIMADFPYDEREDRVAEQFQAVLQSITVVD